MQQRRRSHFAKSKWGKAIGKLCQLQQRPSELLGMNDLDPLDRLLWDLTIASEIEFEGVESTDRLPGESVKSSVMRKIEKAKKGVNM